MFFSPYPFRRAAADLLRGSAHHLFNLFIAQALHDGIDVIRSNVRVDGNEHLINEVLVGNPVAGFFCIPAGHFSQLLSAGDGDEVEGEVNGQAVFAAAGAALRTGNQCVVGSGKHSCGLGRNSLDSNQVNAGVAGRVFSVECGFQGGAQGANAGNLDVDAEALFHFVNHGSALVVGLAGAHEHLVVAGDAFTQLPITSDYISAKMFLESINPSLISKQGTAIGEAINLAARSFTPQEGVGRAIIVITDGENHEGGAVEAAKAAAEKGIQVSVLGVGMPDGAPIPVEGTNDYRRDREGNVIVTRLNEAMCQEIAKEGKGIYVRVDNSNSAQRAINQEVNKMAKSDVESKVYTEFNEQFQAIAWVILLLLLAEILILDRKNPLFKNIHLFSNKK